MRAVFKPVAIGVLLLTPISMLGASVPNFPPNPVGEKLFRAQMYHEMLLPVVIIVCALLAAGLVHLIGRKSHKADMAK